MDGSGAVSVRRRMAGGAEVLGQEQVHFRVYAPKRERVDVVVVGRERPIALCRDDHGWFSGLGEGLRAGTLYRFRLDDDEKLYPDPMSRFQPEGPHGPSEVIDPSRFPWTDSRWRGIERKGQVLYEMHVGTFTREGTFAAAMRELPELHRIGITTVELMPLAEFPGRFGWGYDGVDLFAPTRLYGRPDDVRAFVDRAHEIGLGVILDVVYNHFGPSGNYLRAFSDTFFTDRYKNDWGEAIDFETDPFVRTFFIENAAYWIREFHFDGLRFDATQNIEDTSPRHILGDLAQAARAAAPDRKILLVAENESQHAHLVRSLGFDTIWNDDFHHAARVAATGRAEAYYSDTKGTPQELVSAIKWGFLFQGQYYTWQDKCRGTPALDLPPEAFVLFLENHDQVANSASGARLHAVTDPGILRALTTTMLLAPGTPMLFQGQEFAASAPFLFFADHERDLAGLVAKGRLEFLLQFPSLRDPHVQARITAPDDEQTFERCKIDWTEREKHRPTYDLHIDLLRLRREDPVFAAQDRSSLHGAVLSNAAFLLRYGDERLVLVNLAHDLDLRSVAEPLIAPPFAKIWRVLFSTEDPRYGGLGTPPIGRCGQVTIPARSALVLEAVPVKEEEEAR
jgi:maltooligosyltrehalose trehalohydrolase